MKEYSDSESTRFPILSGEEWCPATDELPTTITPVGLPLTRQVYLYEQIRDYCRDGTEDLVCPKPLTYICDSLPDLSAEEDANGHAVVPHPK